MRGTLALPDGGQTMKLSYFCAESIREAGRLFVHCAKRFAVKGLWALKGFWELTAGPMGSTLTVNSYSLTGVKSSVI